MTIAPHIKNPGSATKLELDRLEFIVRVPSLRRQNSRVAVVKVSRMFAYAHDRDVEDYELLPRLPRHPAVIAYADELAEVNSRRDRDIYGLRYDLKTARRKFFAAHKDYEKRSRYREDRRIQITPDEERGKYADFARFVSLSAILEARAEAMHWFKIVMEREHIERVKTQNRWSLARSRVTPRERWSPQ
jgi:hypothetical protein